MVPIRLAKSTSPAALRLSCAQRLPKLTKRLIILCASSVFPVDKEIKINSKPNKVIAPRNSLARRGICSRRFRRSVRISEGEFVAIFLKFFGCCRFGFVLVLFSLGEGIRTGVFMAVEQQKTTAAPTVLDLFSGAGGIAQRNAAEAAASGVCSIAGVFDVNAVQETIQTCRTHRKPYAVVLNGAPALRDEVESRIVTIAREALAKFKAPRAIVFGEVPKTSTGTVPQRWSVPPNSRG